MKGLKYAAIAAFSLLMVTAFLVGYLFLTAEVQIVDVSIKAVSAAENAERFENIKNGIDDETFYGTVFHKPLEWKPASEYVFLTYTLRIRNNCLVPIDMLEVQVVPQNTDVVQIADLEVKSLDMKTEGEVEVQILTTKDAHSIRELLLSYYLWGVSGNVKTVYGQ